MYCFVLHIGINVYFTNNKETHRSCACFQRANTRSGRMFGRVCSDQRKTRWRYTCTCKCQDMGFLGVQSLNVCIDAIPSLMTSQLHILTDTGKWLFWQHYPIQSASFLLKIIKIQGLDCRMDVVKSCSTCAISLSK